MFANIPKEKNKNFQKKFKNLFPEIRPEKKLPVSRWVWFSDRFWLQTYFKKIGEGFSFQKKVEFEKPTKCQWSPNLRIWEF